MCLVNKDVRQLVSFSVQCVRYWIVAYVCFMRYTHKHEKAYVYTCSVNHAYLSLSLSDSNQCATNNGGCDHNCTDLIPGYLCSCDPGFLLDSDGHSCNGESN